jgi:hypothetical protein
MCSGASRNVGDGRKPRIGYRGMSGHLQVGCRDSEPAPSAGCGWLPQAAATVIAEVMGWTRWPSVLRARSAAAAVVRAVGPRFLDILRPGKLRQCDPSFPVVNIVTGQTWWSRRGRLGRVRSVRVFFPGVVAWSTWGIEDAEEMAVRLVIANSGRSFELRQPRVGRSRSNKLSALRSDHLGHPGGLEHALCAECKCDPPPGHSPGFSRL